MARKRVERRKAERRTTPPMVIQEHCETICKPVDEKLEDIWSDVKSKTPNRVFWIIVSGLAFLSVVILGGMLWSFGGTLSNLDKSVSVTNANLSAVNQSINYNATNIKELKDQVKDNLMVIDKKFEKLDEKIDSFHSNNKKGGKY